MKKLIFSLIIFSFAFEMYSQITQLPEVVISPLNYKYLNSVGSEDTDMSVKMLEEKVANFDLKSSEYYNDEYETYTISFFIPEGKILAAYNNEGEVIRTIERFKNIKLPKSVLSSISKRFPNWSLEKDIYTVSYNESNGNAIKEYKVKLKNQDQVVRVKLNEDGEFL